MFYFRRFLMTCKLHILNLGGVTPNLLISHFTTSVNFIVDIGVFVKVMLLLATSMVYKRCWYGHYAAVYLVAMLKVG